MAEKTLGPVGKGVAWFLYLFLFYSLMVAYMSGGGHVLTELICLLGGHCAPWMGPFLFTLLFAPWVVISARAVDRINAVLMGGLFFSFCAFVALGLGKINSALFLRMDMVQALWAIPVVFTSFGFQGMVPTLTEYLGRDPRRVRCAILWGSVLPLGVYILWEALILGIIPLEGLEAARLLGHSAVAPLKDILSLPWLFWMGEAFAFFAVGSSFLGVTLGLLDFLADGLRIRKTWGGRLGLAAGIFFPPLFCTLLNPRLFLLALHYAGGVGCALLLGFLPLLMVWKGRYSRGYQGEYRVAGGRLFLVILFLFIVLEFMVALLKIV